MACPAALSPSCVALPASSPYLCVVNSDVTDDVVDSTSFPATSAASQILLNPSKEAKSTSPGSRRKNLFPIFEFANELVKNPETFTTPVNNPFATFWVLIVILFTL
uniref:Uncharacterized protein n=1 Tax=Opuntia streptacantha TaxID=393608 RepID=A0A7C9CJR3_OPUST